MTAVDGGQVDDERERARAAALDASRREFERLVEEERARAPKKRIPLGVRLEVAASDVVSTDEAPDGSAG